LRTGTGLDDFIDIINQFFLLGIEPRFLGCPAVENVGTSKASDTKKDSLVDSRLTIHNNIPTN
jgi:hypothetical protein